MGRCRGALVGLEVMGVKILWEGGFVTLFGFFFVLSLSLVAARCCSSCLARGGGALMFLENKPPPPHEAREGFAHFQEKGSACPVIIRSFVV